VLRLHPPDLVQYFPLREQTLPFQQRHDADVQTMGQSPTASAPWHHPLRSAARQPPNNQRQRPSSHGTCVDPHLDSEVDETERIEKPRADGEGDEPQAEDEAPLAPSATYCICKYEEEQYTSEDDCRPLDSCPERQLVRENRQEEVGGDKPSGEDAKLEMEAVQQLPSYQPE
jgi:hypothetical protein